MDDGEKLEMFFSNQPTNTTRVTAFILWLSEATHFVIKATIVFQIGREQMIRTTLQLAKNSS
jgi:hypothetical protein